MKKIQIENIKEKYNSNKIQTNRLDNYNIYHKETYEKLNTNRKIFNQKQFLDFMEREITTLIDVRINELKIVFGEQDFIFKDEYNMYAWTVEHNNCEAIILSGKGKGTSVEIILNEKGRPKGSINNFFYDYKALMTFFKYEKVTKNNYEAFQKNPELYMTSKKYNL